MFNGNFFVKRGDQEIQDILELIMQLSNSHAKKLTTFPKILTDHL